MVNEWSERQSEETGTPPTFSGIFWALNAAAFETLLRRDKCRRPGLIHHTSSFLHLYWLYLLLFVLDSRAGSPRMNPIRSWKPRFSLSEASGGRRQFLVVWMALFVLRSVIPVDPRSILSTGTSVTTLSVYRSFPAS